MTWLNYLRTHKCNVTFFSVCVIVVLGVQFKYHTAADAYYSSFDVALEGPLSADDLRVLEALRNKYIGPPSSKPYKFSQDPKYNRTKSAYSWPFIHYFTKKLFANQTGGFFVEAGALDGEYLSNSLWLETDLNWKGLLIESDPYNYKELLLKNRRAWMSNTCLSSKPYPKKTIMISRRTRQAEGNSGYMNWVYRGSSHEMGYTLPPIYDILFASTTPTYISVQCFPLYSYLLALNTTTIDLISLDIQGSELEVIMTLPFDKVKVRVFVIEHNGKSKKNTLEPSFVDYFQERGYKLIGCIGEPDYIFILRDDSKAGLFEEKTRCYGEKL